MDENMLYYKGKPMMRRDNVIYYGEPDRNFFVTMTINETESFKNTEIPSRITVELRQKLAAKSSRKADRENLYSSLDLGEYWLLEALGEI